MAPGMTSAGDTEQAQEVPFICHEKGTTRDLKSKKVLELLDRTGLEVKAKGRRAGSAVKSLYCSCRGPEFGSKHPYLAAHSGL